VDLNVDERSESREVVVQVRDGVDGRGNVADGQLAGQLARVAGKASTASAASSSSAKHRATSTADPVEVELLVRRESAVGKVLESILGITLCRHSLGKNKRLKQKITDVVFRGF
jgi:hypothetical protein